MSGDEADRPPRDGADPPPVVDEPTAEVEAELSEDETEELIEELEHKRSVRGTAAIVVSLVAVTFSAYQVWLAARGFVFSVSVPFLGTVGLGSLQQLQIRALHVGFALVLAFLLFPPTTGDGRVARLFGRVVPALTDRLGPDHPLSRTTRGLRSGVRWATVDAGRERVTPVDVVLVLLTVATVAYMLNDYREIQTMRALGLSFGRPIAEAVPPLAPIVHAVSALGIPIDQPSYAFVLGVIGVLLVLEATRRTLGTFLMLLVSAFVLYARYAGMIPHDVPFLSILATRSAGWPSVIQNLWYNTSNGVFGIPVGVSVRFIYIFILFGAFLEMSGAGQWFIDLAYSITGARKGGPAKASILSSGMMGTISGSSIANTVTTGAFTIPLMKRSGYRPAFAGAVEASASTGGQILPPVMGAAAFLIVEYIGVPYDSVIIAAAIPAIVFFFGVWVMVHLEASRVGIGGVDPSTLGTIRSHLVRGWFYLAPIVLLLYYLVIVRYSVARSAWYTIVAIVALIGLVAAYDRRSRIPLAAAIGGLFVLEVGAFATTGAGIVGAIEGTGPGGIPIGSAVGAAAGSLGTIVFLVSVVTLLLRPRIEAGLLDYDHAVDQSATTFAAAVDRPAIAENGAFRYGTFLFNSMEAGARTATTVVVAVAAAGVIPGVISVSGLGPNLVSLIEALAGGSLVLLLVITAISSIILGMGMPTTVTYIILVALLGAPIAHLSNTPLLAAHLFILYFGVIADITPPVAVAAYAASGIAKSEPFSTGVQAFSLSLNKALVPFAFVFTPGLLLIRGQSTEAYHILTFADVLDVGYFVPQVLVPIAGVFLGVFALGPTIIGYLYTDVSGVDRALFAVAAILLMIPGVLIDPLLGMTGAGIDPVVLDVSLRVVGGLVLAGVALKNRRAAGAGRRTPRAESA